MNNPTHKLLAPTSEAPFGSLEKIIHAPTDCTMYSPKYYEYEAACKNNKPIHLTSELKGIKVGDLVTEGVEFNIKNRAVFQDGNYGQVCKSCNDTFYKAHKYWFLCEKCCKTPVAIPLENEPKNDLCETDKFGPVCECGKYYDMFCSGRCDHFAPNAAVQKDKIDTPVRIGGCFLGESCICKNKMDDFGKPVDYCTNYSYNENVSPVKGIEETQEDMWNEVGNIIHGGTNFTFYEKYIIALKEKFTITRK